ncbi:MAG: hypothetical protein ACUVRZ_05565 [Desulfobacca sp.]|uniref:hypothetical protein n=1 Tax=Desulfobacca sp. TaxID=2067990 RepID=UPI004049934A
MEARIESAVCPGCACLCDDIDVTVVDGQVYQAANICLWGASKVLGHKRFHPKKARRRLEEPQIRHRSRWETVSFDAALERTAAILTQARHPVVYGLTNASCEAQTAALQVARLARARLEPADLIWKAPYYQSLKKYGVFWATLEVIRDEADTMVFWGANPLHACPRHVVRYSVFARGRFTERGHEERRLAAVDIHRTELADLVELFLQVEPGQDLALLQELLALTAAPGAAGSKKASRLAAMLHEAQYGVLFFGRGVSYGPTLAILDGLAALTARLNERAPFVLFPLSTDFNAVGLYHLLLRELGSPLAPDFGVPGEVGFHAEPICWTEIDALLVVGADPFWFLSADQIRDLHARRVPVVALSPVANRTTGHAEVVLPVAYAGIETPALAYRMDGLPLSLPALLPASLPSDQQLLQQLAATLGHSQRRAA